MTSKDRSDIILDYAQRLKANTGTILEANARDIKAAKDSDKEVPGNLVLSMDKIETLVNGMNQIASNRNIVGRVLKTKQLADGVVLKQVTVPLGVIMVIFEGTPDSLPQVRQRLKQLPYQEYQISNTISFDLRVVLCPSSLATHSYLRADQRHHTQIASCTS